MFEKTLSFFNSSKTLLRIFDPILEPHPPHRSICEFVFELTLLSIFLKDLNFLIKLRSIKFLRCQKIDPLSAIWPYVAIALSLVVPMSDSRKNWGL